MHHVPLRQTRAECAPCLAPPAPHLPAWRFEPVDEVARPVVERFVFDAYRTAYGAHIASFMPDLLALNRGAELVAACGMRAAADEPLFLEGYLERPIEDVLAAVAGVCAGRSDIVEVGNLAIARPGAARMLIEHLTVHLQLRRERWVVFTAVPVLRNNFLRLRIPLHVLGEARPDLLTPEARRQWGRYYDCSPKVSAVRVADAAAALGLAG